MEKSTNPRRAKAPLILTLDVGSSSLRASLYDAGARRLDDMAVRRTYRLAATPDGGATLDADQLLNQAVRAIDALLDRAGDLAGEIGGVAIDTLVANVLGVDGQGRPLTPVYTYADTRSAPDADQLRREMDEEAVHDRTGCPVHSSYLPARFRWLARTRPDRLRRAARWISLGEYLTWHFFGEYGLSHSVASWTGLLNRQTLAWDEDWLARLPLDAGRLSPLVDLDQPRRGLLEPWAGRWPALRDAPWFPAVGDGAAANIGSGCAGPGRVALTIGTSGAMRVVLEGQVPAVPAGLWSYRVDRRRSLLGGATSEGGNVYAWLRDTLRLPGVEGLEDELARMEPAAHGLTFLPFLAGERSPGWRGEARASLTGLGLGTRPIDILRAGLEGVAYRFALIHRRLAPYLPPEHRIIGSGAGLLASPAWLQIMADVLGRPLVASAEPEATSRGAALLALEALGLIEDAAALPAAVGQTYRPDADRHARYQAAIAGQVKLYRAIIE
ncbi:MAG: gluconokinase, partial [Anaerolineae bacterium]